MEMSITRGLSELKTLDARINKSIGDLNPVAIHSGKKSVRGYKSNEEFVTIAVSGDQSVEALIKRRNRIKAAIVASNAKVEVEIGGKTMTVAEAIERKSSIIYEQNYLMKLIRSQQSVLAEFNRETERVKDKTDQLVEALVGKDKKMTEDEYKTLTKSFMEDNEVKMIDPLDVKKKIANLEIEIDGFVSEVDFVLSESNSRNMIVIEDN